MTHPLPQEKGSTSMSATTRREKAKHEDAKPVLVIPTTTDALSVKSARDAGYVVVLCDEPDKVRVCIAASPLITPDDLLRAAFAGVEMGGITAASTFFSTLHKSLRRTEVATKRTESQ